MDDLQFRRSMYADPKSADKAMQEAINEDHAKQRFAKELEILDDKILAAMKVPVPDDLYDRLILRQTMVSHHDYWGFCSFTWFVYPMDFHSRVLLRSGDCQLYHQSS